MRTGYEGGLWGAGSDAALPEALAYEIAAKAAAIATIEAAGEDDYVKLATVAVAKFDIVGLHPNDIAQGISDLSDGLWKQALDDGLITSFGSGSLKKWVARSNGLI
jgi:hypothetical protein